MFLGILGFLGFIVFGIMWVISLIRKSGKAKRNIIITGSCFLLFIVGVVSSSDSENKEEAKKDDKAIETSKEEKPKKEDDNRTTVERLQDDDGVDKVSLNDGILTIEKQPGGLWDENSLFHSVYDLFEVMNDAFKDESIDEVEVKIQTKMTDAKGNESLDAVIEYLYTRESFEELNYDNFTNMAFSEQWRILNESDLYTIHPGIYKNLKDKYTDNLPNGAAKLPPVE